MEWEDSRSSVSLSDPTRHSENKDSSQHEARTSLAKAALPTNAIKQNKVANYIVRGNVNFLMGDGIYSKRVRTAGNLSGKTGQRFLRLLRASGEFS